MSKRGTTSKVVPSLVLDPEPLQRRAQAWHSLAALRAKFRRPSLQLFGGPAPVHAANRVHQTGEVQVPENLLVPHRSCMD